MSPFVYFLMLFIGEGGKVQGMGLMSKTLCVQWEWVAGMAGSDGLIVFFNIK